MKSAATHIAVLTILAAATAARAAPVPVVNADFELGASDLEATGWTDIEVSPGVTYYKPSSTTFYADGRAASFMNGGGGMYQDLAVTAAAGDAWTINFDAAFRDDAFTGSTTIRVALLDGIGGSVIDSDDIVVSGNGSANTASIPFSAEAVVLNTPGASVNNIVLRFTNVNALLSEPWRETALVDNVSVDRVAAAAIPAPAAMPVGLALIGLMAARRRRL